MIAVRLAPRTAPRPPLPLRQQLPPLPLRLPLPASCVDFGVRLHYVWPPTHSQSCTAVYVRAV